MANMPYIDGNESKVLGILKMYSRMGQYPLDATSVFNTKEDLLEYINETGSYAYPGQVVAVANGDVKNSAQDDDYSLYIIRSDRTIQEIGKNLTFTSTDEAVAFIASSKPSIRPGELITIASEDNGYSLHMVRDDYSLHRLSYEASDTPDVSWANLQGKPVSSPDDIDNAVNKVHEHANKDVLDKVNAADGSLTYDNKAVAYKSDITWDNVDNKPTDLNGYGITDVYTKTQSDNTFIKTSDVVTIPEAGKILKLDDNAQVPASIISGIISLANLPHGAVERCVVVDDDDARFALTQDKVQTGDTVKVNSTGKMYFVVDDAKLNEEAGYEVYTAGAASTVDWSGIQNKPTNLAGYGITDAVNVSEVVESAEAGKILKLDAEGKLPASITGDAASINGKTADDFVAATEVVESVEAGKILKLDAEGKLPASITGDAASINGKTADDFVAATEVVADPQAGKILKLDAEGKLPADITGSATSVEWAGVQNKPTNLAGYGITDAISNADIATVAEPNKLLKLNEYGELPANITGNAATATNVEWTGVQNKPNTLAGYGITDVYNKTEADTNFVPASDISTVAEAGKVLKLNSEAKLPADITGNAATATNVEWTGVQNTPTNLAGYGITDVYNKTQSDANYVHVGDVVETAAPNKILKLDTDGKLPASIISGTIPLANLPHGSLERCVVVASDAARFALTNLNVQVGDTVKVTNTGKMYFVVDDTKLGSEAGYEVYTAGSASSVPWEGITNKPTTVSGYGITDVFTKEESNTNFVAAANVTAAPEAGKILKVDDNGKLPADITGNAATATNVEWTGVQNKPNTLAGYGITDALTATQLGEQFVSVEDVTTVATANKILKLNAEGKLPTDITGTAGAVAWANIVGKPSSEASEIDDAVNNRHAHTNKTHLDNIGVNADGKMTFGQDNVVAYMSDLGSVISVGSVDPAESMPTGGIWFDTSVGTV